jgi:hypothetical protein
MKRLLITGVALLTAVMALGISFSAQTSQEKKPAAPTKSTPTKDVAAQNPLHNMELPGRTEQHRQLQNLVGDWAITGQTFKGCPYGEGKFTAREHNEFMKGGLVLVSRTQYSSLFKNSNQIAFFSVDPTSKQYTYALYSNLGVTIQATGEMANKEKASLVGNAIKWTEKKVNVDMHGAQPSMVYTTEVISPNEYRFNLEAGGIRWYSGIAKKLNAVNPAPGQ